MTSLLRHLIGWIVGVFRSRENLVFENLALRQQLLALHTKRPRRRLSIMHRLFWVALRRVWSGWKSSLVLVTPRTVVAWHWAGFRLYWKWLLRARWTPLPFGLTLPLAVCVEDFHRQVSAPC